MQSPLSSKLHVGICMDGNGRWATSRGLPRVLGHEAGVQAIRRTIAAAASQSIGTLTLHGFSTENWRRPKAEVSALLGLVGRYLREETGRLARAGARVTIIGRRDRLPAGLPEAMRAAEEATAAGDKLWLRLAIDYSGRDAIMNAAATASAQDLQSRDAFGTLVAGDAAVRDIDLIIRTSGEQRLSDFLLWEAAYAELYFMERQWPDFGADDLAEALAWFRSRDRRFGGLSTAA